MRCRRVRVVATALKGGERAWEGFEAERPVGTPRSSNDLAGPGPSRRRLPHATPASSHLVATLASARRDDLTRVPVARGCWAQGGGDVRPRPFRRDGGLLSGDSTTGAKGPLTFAPKACNRGGGHLAPPRRGVPAHARIGRPRGLTRGRPDARSAVVGSPLAESLGGGHSSARVVGRSVLQRSS